MSWALIVSADAEADVRDAMQWLDGQRPGLAREFVARLDETLRRIAEHPHAYAAFREPYRRALIRQFPYAVVYIVRPRLIEVAAVFHTKRHPRSVVGQSRS